MMAEKTRFFVFTGTKTSVSDSQAVGNLLAYTQSTVTVFVGISEHKICHIHYWMLFIQGG